MNFGSIVYSRIRGLKACEVGQMIQKAFPIFLLIFPLCFSTTVFGDEDECTVGDYDTGYWWQLPLSVGCLIPGKPDPASLWPPQSITYRPFRIEGHYKLELKHYLAWDVEPHSCSNCITGFCEAVIQSFCEGLKESAPESYEITLVGDSCLEERYTYDAVTGMKYVYDKYYYYCKTYPIVSEWVCHSGDKADPEQNIGLPKECGEKG